MTDRAAGQPDAAGDSRFRPPEDLITSGLLWLINRTVFHPRGLALGFRTDVDGQLIDWTLLRAEEGTPFAFTSDDDRDGFERAEATLRGDLREREG